MGNLYFSMDNLKYAEEFWNDSLDALFEKLYSVKNFRELLKSGSDVAGLYGQQELIISLIVLAKLAKLIYRKDLHMQRECVLMASEISFLILKTSMPNPQNIKELGLYRLKDLSNSTIFDRREDLNPCELLYYLNQ